jgi:hypothetical protein
MGLAVTDINRVFLSIGGRIVPPGGQSNWITFTPPPEGTSTVGNSGLGVFALNPDTTETVQITTSQNEACAAVLGQVYTQQKTAQALRQGFSGFTFRYQDLNTGTLVEAQACVFTQAPSTVADRTDQDVSWTLTLYSVTRTFSPLVPAVAV